MTIKQFLKTGAVLLAAALLALFLLSCAEEEPASRAPYDEERMSDYLCPVTYKDLTVTVSENESRGGAVWRAVLSGVTVREYPEEQVAYYREQIQRQYEYLADREDMKYEDLLSLRGMTEEAMLEKARDMVKSDLVFLWVARDAGISLSEAEKSVHYDRYADKYVERHGYDRAYVDANLREEVYASMLFDKTMEYLILHNSLQEEA